MSQDIQTIKAMHTYKRPANSPAETEYIERFIKPVGVEQDPHGNLYKIVGDKPSILWSSHTDTVHRGQGRQRIAFDGKMLTLPEGSPSNCLGADCTIGNWIMLEMIRAGVPGLYVFHYAEERGCIGSRDIADKSPQFLDGIQAAIAFDRKACHSIITKQGERTCSDAFGKSLMEQLEGYELDPTGILTDTKHYRRLVPECTNLSVGYYGEHTPSERQDVEHALKLRDMMCRIDASKFVIERDPKVVDLPSYRRSSFGLGSGIRNHLSDEDIEAYYAAFADADQGLLFPAETLGDLLWQYPDDCANALREMGIKYDDLRERMTRHRCKRLARYTATK